MLKDIFALDSGDMENLIEPTADGLGLKLKAGKHIALNGICRNKVRNLNIEFSYNRTFSGKNDYPYSGSWTRNMRPDYTLSFWPEDFSRDEAERQELIVHIHFDAKYRVESLGDIIGNDDLDLDQEKEDQRSGTYKRADLLKMHAYKDAIRRTGGAYVLYPGNDNEAVMKGFHEIIPGLGAFAVRPSRNDDGSDYLKSFINRVVQHLLDRTSQRDRLSYRTYNIYKNKNDFEVHEAIPEYYDGIRSAPPEETVVLVGYCKSEEHYKWIHDTNLYNFRVTGRGGLPKHVDPRQLSADYILIHKEGELITGDIRKIIKNVEPGPERKTKANLIALLYPDEPSQDEYLVYELEADVVEEFAGAEWDIRKLKGYKGGKASAIPFAVTLADLMKAKTKE